ncbi:MAG: SRPBCC family protein [Promethearchaeota archaeon]
MPRLDRKIEIDSAPEIIFNIVTDGVNTPKWNPTVSAVTPIEDDKIQLETDIGGITIINTETEENKSTTWYTEKSDMNSIGYILNPKKPTTTQVIIWTDYDDKKQSKLFKKTADRILEGLKFYAEFLQKGGDPSTYNKWELLAPL